MSLQHIADHIAAQGRHGDNTLIHVSKKELAGLEALGHKFGKPLTTNPHTGLPEAFSWKNLLPMAAGAALTIGSGGSLSPLTAGMMVGGASALASGSLKQGILDGMGAWGGAGLGAGIGAGTAASAGTGVGTAAQTALPEAVAAPIAPSAGAITSSPVAPIPGVDVATTPFVPSQPAYTGLPDPTAMTPQFNPVQPMSTPNYSAYTGGASQVPPTTTTAAPIVQTPPSGATTGATTGANTSTPFQQFTANAEANPKYIGAALAPGLAEEMLAKPKSLTPKPGDTDMGQRWKYEASNQYATPKYTAISNDEAKKLYGYSGGGDVQLQPGLEGLIPEHMKNALRGSLLKPQSAEEQSYAMGGVTSLGGYSDGGRMLKGPGDGMSDSIPAKIGAKQPARLADGEFVVPADVVSHLGNGSTDAGAKQLYKMMDKIRAARTGRKAQGRQINPNKFLPA